MRVGVIGASGYVGLELLRIALRHPEFELVAVTSEQRAGRPVGDAFPSLRGQLGLAFEPNDPAEIAAKAELVFVALPHSASARTVQGLRAAGVRVVDTSADFRLRDLATYEKWYGEHPARELFGTSVYGLPELYREELRRAELVAAPGCFPTSALLPLVPFLRAGLVETDAIHIDSKTGVSGAGRKLDEAFLFAELDDNSYAYNVANRHRHVPEMEQEASAAAGSAVRITFVPHLIPTIRGIVTTIYLRLPQPLDVAAARQVLVDAYADEPFVRILPSGETPSLAAVRGSNFCDVSVFVDERTRTAVLLCAIDNLVKGASGSAVQSANVMCGLPEEMGLREVALVP